MSQVSEMFSDNNIHRDRQKAESFGSDAERYDRARPRYPESMINRIVAAIPGRDVLDVGCGTGIATRQFRAAGCSVLGVEPDPRMAEVALRDGLEVEEAAFEEWDPVNRAFDAVVSAQAWHWVDSPDGTVKAARLLRPNGRLAVFWNVGQPTDAVKKSFSDVYRRVMPDLPFYDQELPGLDRYEAHFSRASDGIQKVGVLSNPERWQFDWERTYARAEWLDQLATRVDHIQFTPAKLEEVLNGIGEVIDTLGGDLTVHYTTVVVTAKRIDCSY